MQQIREPNPTIAVNRSNASKAGLATAAKYSPEVRAEWGRKGGLKTQERYSNDYFRHIRSLRKKY